MDPNSPANKKVPNSANYSIGFTLSPPPQILLPSKIQKAFSDKIHDQVTVLVQSSDSNNIALVKNYLIAEQKAYKLIVWADISSTSSVYLTAQDICHAVGLHNRRSRFSLLKVVEELFSKANRWLLVLENYDISPDRSKWDQFLATHTRGKVILLTSQPIEDRPADLTLNCLPEAPLSQLFQQILPKVDCPQTALEKLYETLGHSPSSLRLALHLYKQKLEKDPNYTLNTLLNQLEVETSYEKLIQLLLETLKGESSEAYSLILALVYFQSDALPIQLLEALQPKSGEIERLIRFGLLTEDQKGALFSIDRRCQQVVLKRHSETSLAPYFHALKTINSLFALSREQYSNNPSTKLYELLAKHVEAILQFHLSQPLQESDRIQLATWKAQTFNSLGRFFQLRECFDTALKNYAVAIEQIDTKIPTLHFKQNKGNVLAKRTVAAEILHNQASCALRVWESLPQRGREEAIQKLQRSCIDLQMSDAIAFGGALTKDEKYRRRHFAAYSLRALARAYKKQKDFTNARLILERIHRSQEYTHWPRNASVSETLPLSLMDLGVIYRLISKRSSLSHTAPELTMKRSPFAMADTLFHYKEENLYQRQNVGILDAVEKLKESVRIYEDPAYQFPNKHFDLGIALIRLGEAYLDWMSQNPLSERSSLPRVLGMVCFQKAKKHLVTHFDGESSLNYARADFRLAELYAQSGNLSLAAIAIEDAIYSQEMFLEANNPHLVASYQLQQTILRKKKRGQEFSVDSTLEKSSQLAQDGLKAKESGMNKLLHAQREMALQYYIKNNFEEALKQFSRVLRTDPDDPLIRTLYGEAFLRKGSLNNALNQYFKLIEDLEHFSLDACTPLACSAVDHLLATLRRIYGDIQNTKNEEIYQPRPAKLATFSLLFEQSLSKELTQLLKQPQEINRSPWLMQILGSLAKIEQSEAASFTGILESLHVQIDRKNLPNSFFLDAFSLEGAYGLFHAFDLHIDSLIECFEEQIKAMDRQSLELFAQSSAKRIVTFLSQLQTFDSMRLKETLWMGLLRGEDKNVKICLRGSVKTTVDEVLRNSGVQTSDHRKFVLKENDRSEDLGFRLGQHDEVIQNPLYVEVNETDQKAHVHFKDTVPTAEACPIQ